MAESEEFITVDPLFVGLTRPATLYGIPYFAAVLEFMIVTIAFLAVGNPLSLLAIVPVHGILYLVSSADNNIFAAIALWSKTNALCQNRYFWGVVTFSPLAIKELKKETDR